MVPLEVERAKQHARNDGEYYERQCLLNHLELYERKRAAVVDESEAVGWHLAAIFKERDEPAQKYNAIERQVGILRYLRETEMSVPCQSHKGVAHNEQQNTEDAFL